MQVPLPAVPKHLHMSQWEHGGVRLSWKVCLLLFALIRRILCDSNDDDGDVDKNKIKIAGTEYGVFHPLLALTELTLQMDINQS